MITVTARRILGTGLEAPAQSIRAAQADLLDALPGVRLPDLGELRARGVLGAHPQRRRARDEASGLAARTTWRRIPPADVPHQGTTNRPVARANTRGQDRSPLGADRAEALGEGLAVRTEFLGV